MAPIVLLVDFLADGRCSVHSGLGSMSIAAGQDVNPGHSGGARTDVPGSAASSRGSEPPPSAAALVGSGFQCPISYAGLGSGPVDLRVVLPPGIDRSTDAFPRLEWHTEGPYWIGSASLPSAPAFVSLHRSSVSHAGGAAFGWNFYGFFVFAALFIAVYFLWARRMQQRVPSAAR